MGSKVQNIVLDTLAVCLVILTVIYARLTQKLDINVNSNSKSSTWDIHFENLNSNVIGKAKLSSDNQLKIMNDSTTISGSVGNLYLPGDSIIYTFDIVNKGTIPAVLSVSPTISAPECSSLDITLSNNVCSNVEYTLTYVDGTDIRTGDSLDEGEKRAAKLTLSLKQEMSLVPSEDVNITNIAATLFYSQK